MSAQSSFPFLTLLLTNFSLAFFQGNKIHANVRKTLICRFEKDLREGAVYSMSYFGVACNGGNFRTTRHEYKLNFQMGTKVLLIDNGFVIASPFSIVPIAEISDIMTQTIWLVSIFPLLLYINQFDLISFLIIFFMFSYIRCYGYIEYCWD